MPDDTVIKRTAEEALSARSDGEAESVFSDSEEEGEILAGKRDVASDEEDDAPQDGHEAAHTRDTAGEHAVNKGQAHIERQ